MGKSFGEFRPSWFGRVKSNEIHATKNIISKFESRILNVLNKAAIAREW